eukprot:CAMPEP_0204427918 /NCGR_PEP_ID=MMETSP0470-20130426/56406_1 /ASSEMBLY_ACC=CAM_ASM_000385 /TAXON_ID=2969 /ORGANISM="Oxyrrhis marina" /LENGTH=40 /DNA_ID= /DNA_START= /DNA_END= /DNA_ORIENTATION=
MIIEVVAATVVVCGTAVASGITAARRSPKVPFKMDGRRGA